MDQQTLAAYDLDAADFAAQWHDQPAPHDLHALVGRFFRPGPTADIGCGSGREGAWLGGAWVAGRARPRVLGAAAAVRWLGWRRMGFRSWRVTTRPRAC